ncbi:pilus assembly FimT family protein [Leptothrix discophora]|uniref:Prepilin-type N-terminal cleavage/methylation domain-containing protein n=1 Tax=Leptothrix discophora TaxID=89 RepID=A0ABT9G607_LEPDI|nr:prepilin-type N-terminal cleavage/methylation domain-containing protein [Leptothrix discophora]MDP4301917.1 prepilin-type N-terminal cleavage/methylation domain-containing protein [Leptothrix discophora]
MSRGQPARHPGAQRGFTLLELMIVVALIAVASAVASLALPDPAHTRLEQEAARLATLLEAGRAQSRALGLPVRWGPGPSTRPDAGSVTRPLDAPPDAFHFDGLPEGHDLPLRWLVPSAEALQVELPPGRTSIPLGPEPVIGAQRVVLRLGERRIALASDGIGPFRVVNDDAAQP